MFRVNTALAASAHARLEDVHRLLWWHARRLATLAQDAELANEYYQEGVAAFLAYFARHPAAPTSHGIVEAHHMMWGMMEGRYKEQKKAMRTWTPRPLLPEDILSGQQLWQQIARAVQSLPEDIRKIFLLYYDEEHTVAEIGLLIGRHHSSVTRMLAKAITHIQQAVGVVPPSQRESTNRTCPLGHPRTPENTQTFTTVRGYVQQRCRVCKRQRSRAAYATMNGKD